MTTSDSSPEQTKPKRYRRLKDGVVILAKPTRLRKPPYGVGMSVKREDSKGKTWYTYALSVFLATHEEIPSDATQTDA